jgi:hypothetical protein
MLDVLKELQLLIARLTISLFVIFRWPIIVIFIVLPLLFLIAAIVGNLTGLWHLGP